MVTSCVISQMLAMTHFTEYVWYSLSLSLPLLPLPSLSLFYKRADFVRCFENETGLIKDKNGDTPIHFNSTVPGPVARGRPCVGGLAAYIIIGYVENVRSSNP